MFVFIFKYDNLQAEIEEFKELAAGRLMELNKLMSDHEATKREVEILKNQVSSRSNSFIHSFSFPLLLSGRVSDRRFHRF